MLIPGIEAFVLGERCCADGSNADLHPVFVGCHYFKYADEPLTGRPGDGENYSIGFTTVVDGLYPEMVEAAKKVSGEMYQRRSR